MRIEYQRKKMTMNLIVMMGKANQSGGVSILSAFTFIKRDHFDRNIISHRALCCRTSDIGDELPQQRRTCDCCVGSYVYASALSELT